MKDICEEMERVDAPGEEEMRLVKLVKTVIVDLLQKIMRAVLISCVLDNNYQLLRMMYEECKLSKQQLVEKAKEKRFIATSPSESIYIDMIQVLYDEAVKDPSILDLFYENSKEVFSVQYNKYLKLKELYSKHANWPDYYNDNKDKEYGIMHFFLRYEGEVKDSIIDLEVIDLVYEEDDWIDTMTNCFDSDCSGEHMKFNTGEAILPSLQFKKYLKRKREELTAFANNHFNIDFLTEENIGAFLQAFLSIKISSEKGVHFPTGNAYISTQDAMDIVNNQNGVSAWFFSMTADNNYLYFDSSHYMPDVDELINLHFKNCVDLDVRECNLKGEEFTKSHLVRDCNVHDIEEDFNAILYLYQIDVLCKMFNQMKEEYYLNFSWGETDNREIEEKYEARYEARYKEMQGTIDALNQKLKGEKQKRIAIQEETDKEKKSEVNKLSAAHRKEMAENNKELKRKDKEIAELKKQNALKDEYIEILSAEEESDMEWEADITSLQQKRYLFVGNIDNLPELKRLFPNSVFMDTPQKSLAGIKVDAVVLLVKYMSHKMYYKVKNTASLADVQTIKCNTRNINSICNTMALAVA